MIISMNTLCIRATDVSDIFNERIQSINQKRFFSQCKSVKVPKLFEKKNTFVKSQSTASLKSKQKSTI